MLRFEALVALGRHEEGYNYSSLLMRSQLRSSRVLTLRAQCLYKMDQFDSAVKHFRQVGWCRFV